MSQARITRRILIVDDSPEDRAAVRRLLAVDRSISYEIEEATSGSAGLELLQGATFDCLLLDYYLHDCMGIEFLGELNRLFDDDTMIPVVMLTGQADEDLINEVLKRGAQDYLVKGRFTGEVLRRCINDSVLRVETRRKLDRLHREAREAIRLKDEALARQAATEARLRHQLDLIETVARTTADGLCMIDRRGRFTFLNPAAEAILGGSQAALLGSFVPLPMERFDGQGAGDGALTLDSLIGLNVTIRNRETLLPGPAGEATLIAFSSAPILADGEMVGTVIALRDITEQRRTDAEMQRRAAELVEAARRKDEFLAMLAHELRNPLAPILNAMRIIGLRGGNDPAQERTRAMVEQQVRHMNRLIDDLLDMSRISRGTIQLVKEPTLLVEAVDRAVGSIRHQVDARGQILLVQIPDSPVWLDADPTRLDQILSNLLTNAAKYTDPGGSIRLVGVEEPGIIEIRVIDSGVGIAAEFLPRIFDLFAQADRSLDRSQGGLGIGLTLVRDLVELHGGSIRVHSAGLGMGSEFTIRMPSLAGSMIEPPAVPIFNGEVFPTVRSVRVLVVDDNVHAAQSLEVVLQLWGHEVLVVHDGTSAIDATPVFRPEVILLDIGLPRLDGYKVAEEIRKLPGSHRVAILAMTGYAGLADHRRSAAAGFVRHLVKPLDLDSLEQYLAEFDQSRILVADAADIHPSTDGLVGNLTTGRPASQNAH